MSRLYAYSGEPAVSMHSDAWAEVRNDDDEGGVVAERALDDAVWLRLRAKADDEEGAKADDEVGEPRRQRRDADAAASFIVLFRFRLVAADSF